MASAGTIDPSKPGRFPVVLGDSILHPGAPKDVYTGIRYNHKPSLSTPIAPTTARLKPSPSASSNTEAGPSTFDLSFSDDGSKYMYTGKRTNDPSQYVLTFDAARQVFVLDRVDSMFHMNLSQTPNNADADQLQREFPHLDIADNSVPIKADGSSGGATSTPASTGTKKPPAGASKKEKPAVAPGGAGKKKAKAPAQRGKVPLSADIIRPGDSDDDDNDGNDRDVVVKVPTPALPPPKKPAPKKRQQQVPKKPVETTAIALPVAPPPEPEPPKKQKPKRNSDDEDDEDEDSDDDDLGLTVEYPGGKPPSERTGLGFGTASMPAIPNRRFSELLEQQHEAEHFGMGSDRDADGDADEEEEFDFEAPDEEEGGREEEDSLGSGRFQLPSPVGGHQALGHGQPSGGYEEDIDAEGEGEEMDLEAALMAGLEAEEDSDVSEEE